MSINLLEDEPLVLTIDDEHASDLETIDAGAAYTEHLHSEVGEFDTRPLGEFVEVVRDNVNPKKEEFTDQVFEYVNLREVDEVYGQILKRRIAKGSEIGSTKRRFQTGDILYAKIMPSLENRKAALVTEDVSNAVASTEFIVLRMRDDADINMYYLFRAVRSDQFNRQARANVSGATGRQRIDADKLLELQVVVPPREIQKRIGDAVEEEFTLRTQAKEQARAADDEAERVLGPTTLRTEQ